MYSETWAGLTGSLLRFAINLGTTGKKKPIQAWGMEPKFQCPRIKESPQKSAETVNTWAMMHSFGPRSKRKLCKVGTRYGMSKESHINPNMLTSKAQGQRAGALSLPGGCLFATQPQVLKEKIITCYMDRTPKQLLT